MRVSEPLNKLYISTCSDEATVGPSHVFVLIDHLKGTCLNND